MGKRSGHVRAAGFGLKVAVLALLLGAVALIGDALRSTIPGREVLVSPSKDLSAERSDNAEPAVSGREARSSDEEEPALALRLLDRTDGGPVPGASVEFAGRAVESDAGGLAPLDGLRAEEWDRVRVSHSEYQPASLSRRDARSRSGPDGIVDVSLVRSGELLVHVEDPSGRPVEGAYVVALPWDDFHGCQGTPGEGWPRFEMPGFYTLAGIEDPRTIQAGTDADGRLRIPHLPTGTSILVRARGEVRPVQRVLKIDDRERRAELVLRGETTCRIEGLVRSPSGRPVPGIMVGVVPEIGDLAFRQVGADGRYELAGATLNQRYRIYCEGNRSGVVVQTEDVVHRAPDLVTEETVAVTGILIPPAGISLGARDEWVRLRAADFVDTARLEPRTGRFEGRVPAGRTELSIGRGIRRLAVQEVQAPAEDVRVDLGDAAGGIVLRLRNGREGEPVRVALCHRDQLDDAATLRDVPLIECRDQADGRLSVDLGILPPGRYAALVQDDQGRSAWLPSIDCVVGKAVTVDATLGVAAVDGRVTGEGCSTIGSRDLFGRVVTTTVGDGGRFSLSELVCGPRELYPALTGTGPSSGLVRVELSAGREPGVVTIDGPPRGRVVCTLRSEDDPLEGAVGSLVRFDEPHPGPSRAPVVSDRSGELDFGDVVAGRYLITVSEWRSGAPVRSETRRLRVPPAALTRLEFGWGPPDVVRLLDAEGAPLRGVQSLKVHAPGGGAFHASCPPDGRFEMNLPPGPLVGQARMDDRGYRVTEARSAWVILTGKKVAGAREVVLRAGRGSIRVERSQGTWRLGPIARATHCNGLTLELARFIHRGPDLVRSWDPDGGAHVFSGIPAGTDVVVFDRADGGVDGGRRLHVEGKGEVILDWAVRETGGS